MRLELQDKVIEISERLNAENDPIMLICIFSMSLIIKLLYDSPTIKTAMSS